jgi:vitamin-K-epoxide reductase (warfarin-sensitive)
MRNTIFRILLVLLTVGGLTVSGLALHVHNMAPGEAPPCAVDDHFDCGAVNHSRFADFPPRAFDEDPASHKVHIPVAIIGLVGYSAMLLAAAFGRWWILLQLAEIGFGAACFLTYLEAYVIDKWCIYCLWSQGIVTVIVITTFAALILQRRKHNLASNASA